MRTASSIPQRLHRRIEQHRWRVRVGGVPQGERGASKLMLKCAEDREGSVEASRSSGTEVAKGSIGMAAGCCAGSQLSQRSLRNELDQLLRLCSAEHTLDSARAEAGKRRFVQPTRIDRAVERRQRGQSQLALSAAVSCNFVFERTSLKNTRFTTSGTSIRAIQEETWNRR